MRKCKDLTVGFRVRGVGFRVWGLFGGSGDVVSSVKMGIAGLF